MKVFIDHHLKELDKLIEHTRWALEKGGAETTVEELAISYSEKKEALRTLREVRELFEKNANAFFSGELFE